ncbi:MAG: Mrp/NBP35 family ATP-binding protein [Flavobacteriales bacterium]|jgi:ATP-binding protein involved in chromosome partitioning|nr:Mrp/NBP35 family ATP-binding protein [Flavobacteriales bacterium]MBK7249038.1 Mrp/NBP35 family ATP-binding protein [Flavobacteriales bacterium]MBK7285610.1 Mrp/NBP35 family ATP-binding protein [Flavobacteriales bacterium]MBK9058718.1 Mrp/NBP35 family ATP-binding protein [Flavobacteriales bacterium]MBK9599924.1 Mrp/NBP35 family ATP-binding protein [Flavobacteriales bacterium]
MDITEEALQAALSRVIEPDLKKDIVELDLVQEVVIDENTISIIVEVSNPAMHSRKRMEEAVIFQLKQAFGDGVKVNVSVRPISGARGGLRKVLPFVKHIVAVASGKGGVGKSTITANLAVGLAQRGYKVGLVDADIYGPSMPMMFDVQKERPRVKAVDGKNLIIPVENYGVQMLSIGFFADPGQAIAWRGPMASKALDQLFKDADWGELDIMLVDLPPGTGDIHLSLVQAVPLSGAIIVSTPQPVALVDARKGVGLFNMPSVNVPVLGIVENMSWFIPAETAAGRPLADIPEKERQYIFGKGGARALSEELNVPFMAEVPLVQSIREAADVGRPAVLQGDTPAAQAFAPMLDAMQRILAELEVAPPKKKVADPADEMIVKP